MLSIWSWIVDPEYRFFSRYTHQPASHYPVTRDTSRTRPTVSLIWALPLLTSPFNSTTEQNQGRNLGAGMTVPGQNRSLGTLKLQQDLPARKGGFQTVQWFLYPTPHSLFQQVSD